MKEKELIQSRIEAVGWAWEEACRLTELGKDIREYNIAELIEMATHDLKERNPQRKRLRSGW